MNADQIIGFLDRRFLRTFWLPSLTFWSAIGILFLLRTGQEPVLRWLSETPTELVLIIAAAGLLFLTFFAYLISINIRPLTQLYEGYDWEKLPILKTCLASRRDHYIKLIKEIPAEKYEEIYLHYPPKDIAELNPSHILPTRLGNQLKNAELYPKERYKMDAALFWPRLFTVLPSMPAQLIVGAKADMETMLVVATLATAFAVCGSIISMLLLEWYMVLVCLWGSLIIARLAYGGALESASTYAELFKATFDVYRATLLKTMGTSAPTSYGKEKARWKDLSHIWYTGSPPDTSENLGYIDTTSKAGAACDKPDAHACW